MKAINIQWDIGPDDFMAALFAMKPEETAEFFNMPVEKYTDMTIGQMRKCAGQKFEKDKSQALEIIGLPSSVDIPDHMKMDAETISDWLSDTYGFCHNGFEITADTKTVAEYEVYAAHMRDAQICKSNDTDCEDDWVDYEGYPLLDIVYATDEKDAVNQIVDSLHVAGNPISADALYAVRHRASISTENHRLEAVSFMKNGKMGIKITLVGGPSMHVYVKDGKLECSVE